VSEETDGTAGIHVEVSPDRAFVILWRSRGRAVDGPPAAKGAPADSLRDPPVRAHRTGP
jgi:hypothetical protein